MGQIMAGCGAALRTHAPCVSACCDERMHVQGEGCWPARTYACVSSDGAALSQARPLGFFVIFLPGGLRLCMCALSGDMVRWSCAGWCYTWCLRAPTPHMVVAVVLFGGSMLGPLVLAWHVVGTELAVR